MKSINDKIQENHIIFVHSGMDAEATNKAILNIMSWSKSPEIEINLYLSAEAFDFVNTMALYDVLKSISNPISVYCLGKVGYFSVVFLTLNHKNRYALKHTLVCLNQPYGHISGGVNQQTEMEIEYRRVTNERMVLELILSNFLNKPLEEIHQDLDNDKELSAYEAKDYGLIDEVLE